MKYFRPIFAYSLVYLLLSCSGLAPWKDVAKDPSLLPWSGPGRRAIEQTQIYSHPLSPSGYVGHTRWVANNWSKKDIRSYVQKIDTFLNEIGFIEQCQKSHAWANDINQRVAPYKFIIVSIEPLIVILRPHDFGSLEKRSTINIVGELGESALRTPYLMNYYEYGSEFPFQPDLLWLSPDLKAKPSPLKWQNNGTATITLEKGQILFINKNNTVKTVRK